MAVAIGERLGLTAQQIREGVAHYVSTGSRMRRIRLPEERLIIDDCYNANPQAMAAALTILADTDCRRRVAVMETWASWDGSAATPTERPVRWRPGWGWIRSSPSVKRPGLWRRERGISPCTLTRWSRQCPPSGRP